PQSPALQQPASAAHMPLQMPGMAGGHPQVPPWQTSPVTAVHSELMQQLLSAMHPPLQGFWPLGHAQLPLMHTRPPAPPPLPPEQALWGMHARLQAFMPAGQAQAPAWHVWPPVHSLSPQHPELSMQLPLQSRWPAPQLQALAMQVRPTPQLRPAQVAS